MKTKRQQFLTRFKKNLPLHIMMVIPVIYLILFEFVPLYGLQIAFRDYNSRDGIWNSVWVGLDNFKKFFENTKWPIYLKNTLRISIYSIIVGFPMPIIFALMMHVSKRPVLKKMAQNVSYIPHFISVVVMVGLLNQIFNPLTGLYGAVLKLFGMGFGNDIRQSAEAFDHLYVWSGVWQGVGWGTIVYISALSAVPMDLHEAAMLDGASRLQRVRYVDIPTIKPTIIMMFIMRMGGILGVGREKVYLMQNSQNIEVSEVISTYVYKEGIGKNNMSYGSAVGLMNTCINTAFLLLTNWIVKKLGDEDTPSMF